MQEIVARLRDECELQKEKGHVGLVYGKWSMLWGTIANDKNDSRIQALENYKKKIGDGAFFLFCEENSLDIQKDRTLTGSERKEAVIEQLYRSILP